MQLNQIETLLLQEMEEVKGGRSGVCYCTTGARQSSGTGECVCSQSAALQKVIDPGESCFCPQTGALQK